MPAGGYQRGGGRPKGSKNKKTIALEKVVAKKGISPLDYMLEVLCNTKLPLTVRLDAAKSAAPYLHSRLASVEFKGTMDHKHQLIPADITPELAQAKYLESMGVSRLN
jgi:hypothetical protein